MSSGDEGSGADGEATLPPSPEESPSEESSHSPEAATLRELNLLGRRGHAWLTTKPITRTHLVDWTVKVASAEGVGRLLTLDGANLGYPWVGPWPLGEESSRSLLHTLSPELLVMVAEHVLGPPCLPREHTDKQPHVLDGLGDWRCAYRTTAKYGAWCFHQFLLSCEHVYRTITRDAMELRVEAGARRMACEVSPTVPAYDRLAHTRHLERSAHTALEFTAFSIALTEGVIKPCDWNIALGQEWGVMHANLMIGFARMGFRKNALLARALFQSDLAIRYTYMGIHCTIQCMVHGGGGAILSTFDHANRTWHYMHVHPANEHDRSGPHLPVIMVHSPKEARVTRYAPPAPYSWLTCLRTCASTHWVVFAGLCVPDAVISRAHEDDDFDESEWKGWIAFYNLHTGELQRTIETEVQCGTIKQMWMRVSDDERTLELFTLYALPRAMHDLQEWKHNTNMHIVRRTFAVDAERRVSYEIPGIKTLELHLGEPRSLGVGWRYLVPGEDPNGDGATWMRSNENGPVTVTRAIASAGSGSVVLTMTGDVLAHPTVLKSVSECLTVRRVVVVDHTLQVHHIRHTSHREWLSKPVALISPSGDHVVVTNRWQLPSGGGEHRAFIEVHARLPGGAFDLAARYEIERGRLRARGFDVTKLCAFSPCGRFFLLFFENATCAMIDVGECGRHALLRFRSLCNPAPRFYGNIRCFSNLQWTESGVWLQTTIHATPQAGTASGNHIHCSVQNLSLY